MIDWDSLIEVYQKHLVPGITDLDREALNGILKELKRRREAGEDPKEVLVDHFQQITAELHKRKIQAN